MIIEQVSAKARFGGKIKSYKASLIFSLNEHNKQFELIENIGDDIEHKEYRKISKSLNHSQYVKVWVRKGENKYSSRVFEIEANGNPILRLGEVKTQHSFVFFYMFILGILSLLFLWLNGGKAWIKNVLKNKK